MSIGDIQEILNPITDKYFASDLNFNLENIYSEVFRLEKSEILNMQKDLTRKYQTSQQTFSDLPKKEQEELQRFSFICMLSFDVYLKKQLIEKLIDAKLAGNSRKTDTFQKSRKTDKSTKKTIS